MSNNDPGPGHIDAVSSAGDWRATVNAENRDAWAELAQDDDAQSQDSVSAALRVRDEAHLRELAGFPPRTSSGMASIWTKIAKIAAARGLPESQEPVSDADLGQCADVAAWYEESQDSARGGQS